MSSPLRLHSRLATTSLLALLLVLAPPVGHAQAGDDQIELLERLIKSTDRSDPDYPDFLFRLADEYLARKHDLEARALVLYDKIDAAKASGKQDLARALEKQQARTIADARVASETAVQMFHALVNDPTFASYGRMDEALFHYATELGQLGDSQGMQAAYLRLIKDYPSGTFIPHAYLSFAEHYFNEGDLAQAIKLYEKVTAFKSSSVTAYAHYKLGWCHLNPIGSAGPDYAQSLQAFVASIEATQTGGAGADAAGKQLRREARRDLVRAYVHAGKPDKAWALFQRVGNGPGKDEQHAREMMQWLADEYASQGMSAEAALITAELAAL
ncbi:tetratricopeptide repeat protein [Enhygromyxa salina]|uniref:Uncharacterized protein n=1 Tax=Enhygromyxa salina TaxID=215803 RepID=A0A2S9YJH4_9BACT|nr:tetratricopeptide repeat protein [Enhygromyxa salina]PRQ05249.1 hypothetical protein ENSA7_46990 [Enhygromyxa salina]